MNKIEIRKFISKRNYKYYVYGLYDENKIFYVGVGTKFRVCQHFQKSEINNHNSYKNNYIKSLYKNNKEFSAEILGFFYTREEALLLEKKLILELGRLNNNTGVLTNLTNGGEGTCGVVKKLSEETKRKLSEINKGKVLSEETRRNMSESRKGLTRKESHNKNLSLSNSKKPIVCVETGSVFINLKEAELWLKSIGHKNADRRNIHRSIKTKMKHCGFSFDYAHPNSYLTTVA